MTDLLHILPYALLSSVLTAGALLALLTLFRDRPRAGLTVLVTVPLLGALAFVVFISGFMFTPQLGWTLVTCLLIAVTVIPMALVLAHQLTGRAMASQRAHEAERARDEARRELIAWVGHDLRTPLGVIRAMSEALEDGVVESPDDVREYGRQITGESRRLNSMVDDLFELSRINSGALDLQLAPVSLEPLVTESVRALTESAARRRVTLEIEPGRWPVVIASAAELERVLRNLLSNAIRYTPAGGTVRISSGNDREHGWLRVADRCGGIPAGDLARVFDFAYRGDAARTPGADELSPGAGLGLAIVAGLVEAQRGTVAVDNVPGGCRFDVSLQLAH